MKEDKSKMPTWFRMPINPTGAIFLYVIGIFLFFGLIIALVYIFLITLILTNIQFEFPFMAYTAPLFFYVSLIVLALLLMIDIYTITVAKEAR